MPGFVAVRAVVHEGREVDPALAALGHLHLLVLVLGWSRSGLRGGRGRGRLCRSRLRRSGLGLLRRLLRHLVLLGLILLVLRLEDVLQLQESEEHDQAWDHPHEEPHDRPYQKRSAGLLEPSLVEVGEHLSLQHEQEHHAQAGGHQRGYPSGNVAEDYGDHSCQKPYQREYQSEELPYLDQLAGLGDTGR